MEYTYTGDAIRPFTDLFDGKACELATILLADRLISPGVLTSRANGDRSWQSTAIAERDPSVS